MKHLIWFRNDLRLIDNETLGAGLKDLPSEVAYLFIFDERANVLTPENVPRMGHLRKKFVAESVIELRKRLRSRGADLVCLEGCPEKILPALCAAHGIERIFFSSLFAHEERAEEEAIAAQLLAQGREVFKFATTTLVHLADLGFSLNELPPIFTEFRKRLEAQWHVRPALPEPKLFAPCLQIASTWEPEQFLNPSSRIQGGEAAAWARVKEYIWDQDRLKIYKQTRNGLLRREDSTKLSPWLAHGCISARSLFSEVQRYEHERVKNESTYWLIFELLWRDYFHLLALKFGAQFFRREGLNLRGKDLTKEQPDAISRFEAWSRGQTGFPLVDAAMRELNTTGFIAGRVRQNVASFLTHNCGADWRKGARWFEAHLIDYDPCNNWGNWGYVAGVGTDPRARVFNVVKQSFDYDAQAEYIHRWIPELSKLVGARALTPWEEPLLAAGYPPQLIQFARAQRAKR